jgi:starvation-inducible DNA-binding protein
MSEPTPALMAAMRDALSDTFMFYVEAHIFHWNVRGPRFSQLHSLFGEIYEDAFEAVDGLAERIRTLGEPAPMTASELFGDGPIAADIPITDADMMVEKLVSDNAAVGECLNVAQEAAEACGEVGVANFLQERIDRHAKWAWILESTAERPCPRSDSRYRNRSI